MSEDRNTEIGRSNIAVPVRERIGGRAAARYVLCANWLINATEFWHTIPTGEIAHNIGATSGPNSPRSESDLSADARAHEDNLLLLCLAAHDGQRAAIRLGNALRTGHRKLRPHHDRREEVRPAPVRDRVKSLGCLRRPCLGPLDEVPVPQNR
jgi:hypothetical protein